MGKWSIALRTRIHAPSDPNVEKEAFQTELLEIGSS